VPPCFHHSRFYHYPHLSNKRYARKGPKAPPQAQPPRPPAIEIETNQDYWGVDYAVTDSNFRFAAYVDEVVKVRYLGGLGVLRGIYPSF